MSEFNDKTRLDISRRPFLATIGAVTVLFSGCIGNPFNDEHADQLSGQIVNETEDTKAGRVALENSNGKVIAEHQFELSPEEFNEFKFDVNDGEYIIGISVTNGPSSRISWNADPCKGQLHLTIESNSIEHEFSSC